MSQLPEQKILTTNQNEFVFRSLTADDYGAFVLFQSQVASETKYTLQIPGLLRTFFRLNHASNFQKRFNLHFLVQWSSL